MSRRRSTSRKPAKSDEKMICINLTGLDDLVQADSESSVGSQGTDGEDYDDGEDAEEERGYMRRNNGEHRSMHKQYQDRPEPQPRSMHKQHYNDPSDSNMQPDRHYQDHAESNMRQDRHYQDRPESKAPRSYNQTQKQHSSIYQQTHHSPKPVQHVHSHGPTSHQHYPAQSYNSPPEELPQPGPSQKPHYQSAAGGGGSGMPTCPPAQPHQNQNAPQTQHTAAPQIHQTVPQPPPPQPAPCTPPTQNTGRNSNPTRHYSLNVTACTRGLEKLEAQFEKKPSVIEIRASCILRTTPDRYTDDIENIAKTLKTETEKCIQNSPPEENKGGGTGGQCYQTTMLMNSAAASELRKRVGTCSIPAWVKQ